MTKPVIEDFEIYQGDYLSNRIRLKNGSAIVDIASYTFDGDIRKVSDNSVVFPLHVDTSSLSSDMVYYTILATETMAMLTTERYKYAMGWKDENSKPFTFKVGKVTINLQGVSWD